MEQIHGIATELGLLSGRDCVYLDRVEGDGWGTLVLTGEINGALASRPSWDWVPYRLAFQGVLACFSCELDTYEALAGPQAWEGSSFAWIENSAWLAGLPVREDLPKGEYRHYRLLTYDIAYHVIAVSYHLEVERLE